MGTRKVASDRGGLHGLVIESEMFQRGNPGETLKDVFNRTGGPLRIVNMQRSQVRHHWGRPWHFYPMQIEVVETRRRSDKEGLRLDPRLTPKIK